MGARQNRGDINALVFEALSTVPGFMVLWFVPVIVQAAHDGS